MKAAVLLMVLCAAIAGVAPAQIGSLVILPDGYIPSDVDQYGAVVGTSPQGPFHRSPTGEVVFFAGASDNPPPRFLDSEHVLASYSSQGNSPQAAIWGIGSGPLFLLGGLGGLGPQGQLSEGFDGYSDWVVGRAWPVTGGPSVAFAVRAGTAMTELSSPVPGKDAGALHFSGGWAPGIDLVAGWQQLANGQRQGVVWVNGNPKLLVEPNGAVVGPAHRVAPYFAPNVFAIGENASDGRPWYMNSPGIPTGLGDPPTPGWVGIAKAWVDPQFLGEMPDIIVGSYRGPLGQHANAFIWGSQSGSMPLADVAELHGVPIPGGFDFGEPHAIARQWSFEPLIIVGVGTLDGKPVGWITEFQFCNNYSYTDCDEDCMLSIQDFVCFQTRFALGDPFADCDGDGTLTVDDFVCFYTCFFIC